MLLSHYIKILSQMFFSPACFDIRVRSIFSINSLVLPIVLSVNDDTHRGRFTKIQKFSAFK